VNKGQRELAPRSHRISWLPGMAASLAVTALASCAALPRLDAVPESLTEQATVQGIPDSRLWFDRNLAPFVQVATQDLAHERAALKQQGLPVDPMEPLNLLAISGGGITERSPPASWGVGPRAVQGLCSESLRVLVRVRS
jgi:hypothetical protein